MIRTHKNVREYSFYILCEVLTNEKLLNNEIDKIFNTYDLKDEDKSFIKKECTGVIENLKNIDDIINLYSKVETHKLKKEILIIFRLAIYEMLYMDKVPEYATINEAVNIIKHTKIKYLSGYVNATLKNIANKEKINKKEGSNLNNELKKCYFKILNCNDEKLINEFNDKNIVFKKYDGDLDFKHSSIYYVDKYKYILESNSFKNGDIIIQDASSAYLVDILYDFIIKFYDDYNKMIKILDVCSAPGGKIISLHYLMTKKYKNYYFEARDISEEKISKINENIERLNITDIKLNIKDATLYNENDFEDYDIILCDVPCSGLGVINKKPDIILKTDEKKIKSLCKLQNNILEVSKKYLKKGGILSYSTCTTTKEENENNICDFLSCNKDFEKIYEKRIEINDSSKADGFYMCFMRKNNEY